MFEASLMLCLDGFLSMKGLGDIRELCSQFTNVAYFIIVLTDTTRLICSIPEIKLW